MQQFQNYSINGYPQYQMPMYQPQPLPNPYMERLAQMQNMSYPQSQNPSARIVDNFEAISANDVPMDGNGAVFIKRDGSEIQVRSWSANGTISRSVFKPVLSDEGKNTLPNEAKPEYEAFNGLLGEIGKKVDDLSLKVEGILSKISI